MYILYRYEDTEGDVGSQALDVLQIGGFRVQGVGFRMWEQGSRL